MEIKNKNLFREQCYINGEWVNSYNKEIIEVNNPSTLQIIAKVPKCGKDETHYAIEKANEAWDDWKNRPAIERSAFLRKWFNLIENNKEDLAKIMTLEQGKPLAESRMEIEMANSYVEWNAEEAKRVYGDVIPDRLADRRAVIIKQPVGVVGSITPWNFPSAMITRKCSPALAVGCPVVIKPASQTPLSAFALAALAEEAGFPKGSN